MDAALGLVAQVLRAIGAVWMVVLVAVYGLEGRIERPALAISVTVGCVAWAIAVRLAGRQAPGSARAWLLLGLDLAVVVVAVVMPPLAGEAVTYTGGYPFASLVLGLALAGRRGVVVAAAVLVAATTVPLGTLDDVGETTSTLLFYALGAVALWLALGLLRGSEQRARTAEAALAVAEERATTAAHLHDSVLQTLALVQRQADDPGRVRTLARRQERELREWLFPGAPAGGGAPALGPALERAAEDVEGRHGVAVRVVVAGEAARLPAPEGSPADAALRAAREAMVNAAVHAGVHAVDVYAEVGADGLAVFVRDRGVGFDPDAVGDDRHGVDGSIRGRVRRAGGTASIRSAPGRGTEVELRVDVEERTTP